MSANLHRLFHEQGGKCFYCGGDCWLIGASESKDRARDRLGITKGNPGSGKKLQYARATVEHLVRKADGGGNAQENLVMACLRCNSQRGDIPVSEFKRLKAPFDGAA